MKEIFSLKVENVYRFGRIEAVKVVMALQFSTILVLFLKPIVRTREKFYAFQNATFVLIFALFFSGTHPPTTSSMLPQPVKPCEIQPNPGFRSALLEDWPWAEVVHPQEAPGHRPIIHRVGWPKGCWLQRLIMPVKCDMFLLRPIRIRHLVRLESVKCEMWLQHTWEEM